MRKTLFIIFCLLAAQFVSAQAPSGVAEQQNAIQKRLYQEMQERLRERDMEMQERSLSGRQNIIEVDKERSAGEDAGGCLDIRYIHVSGVSKFKQKYISGKVRELITDCVNKPVLQSIQAGVQKIYIEKGYIGARVYFDFSEVRQNKLNVIISEGILEDIYLLHPVSKKPLDTLSAELKTRFAFPFTRGKVLNLRDIEQGLEQMNKLSSNNAVMEVRPGKAEGSSVIYVDNEKLPKNTVRVTYDNSGSESTGRYRGNLSLSRDNLFSLNENIYINASSTLWDNPDLRYSRSVVASISVPLGYWTLGDSFSYSKYLTTVEGSYVDFESSGDSTGNVISLERMLLRGADYKVSLGAQLNNKDSKNYLEDVFIENSSRKLAIASLYATGTYYSQLGSFFSKLSVNRGLDAFGAKKDNDLQEGSPRAQFTSLSLYMNYSRNFSFINYTASVDGQYGFDDLFGSEQMMIGGETSVRGFRDNSAFGESGVSLRQDLRIPVFTFLGSGENEYINKMVNSLYLGVFADYGFVQPKTYGSGVSLAGAGAKINYYGKYLSGGFTYARSLYAPDSVGKEGNVFYFNVSLNIMF